MGITEAQLFNIQWRVSYVIENEPCRWKRTTRFVKYWIEANPILTNGQQSRTETAHIVLAYQTEQQSYLCAVLFIFLTGGVKADKHRIALKYSDGW